MHRNMQAVPVSHQSIVSRRRKYYKAVRNSLQNMRKLVVIHSSSGLRFYENLNIEYSDLNKVHS